MKRQQKNQSQHINKFFTIFLLAGFVSLLVFSLGSMVLYPRITLRPLAIIKVPSAPVVYLPGPYEAAIIVSPILGAETIDPRDIVTYINNERMKRQAPPLRISKALTQAAQLRADATLKYQNFAHHDPFERIQLDTVLPKVGYPFQYASENIGMGDASAKGFVNGFMSSPSHRANLLDPTLGETGVAVVTGAYNQYYVNIAVQLFAIPATKEQYLGYKQEDVDNYKQLLTDIENQIALTNKRLQNNVEDQDYYEGWRKILIRQREIVTILYNTMLKQQPFVTQLVSLIGEYNKNWTLVPKQSKS